MSNESSSNRIMAVYAGAAPPRNSFEVAIAMEGESARRAIAEQAKPRPRRKGELPPEMYAPLKKEEAFGSWSDAFTIVFLFFVACAVFG